jgi:hypothetical protein
MLSDAGAVGAADFSPRPAEKRNGKRIEREIYGRGNGERNKQKIRRETNKQTNTKESSSPTHTADAEAATYAEEEKEKKAAGLDWRVRQLRRIPKREERISQQNEE